MTYKKNKNGFTMIELLAAVAIIAILILVFIFLMRNQKARGSDARRKADLENIKISFEDYFNDNDCYPDSTALDLCGATTLNPYLKKIPCDPMTGDSYVYEPVASCGGYRAYAVLEDSDDPVIGKLGCDGADGCGATAGSEYNYGIAVGVPLNDSGGVGGNIPGYVYACDSTGICNKFEENNPLLLTCPVTYVEIDCQSACDVIDNRCIGF